MKRKMLILIASAIACGHSSSGQSDIALPSIADRDHDGIPDSEDQCPDEPEDFDGFNDEDGCPDPDNDADGILDTVDRCPNEAGRVEWQGCPEEPDDSPLLPTIPGNTPHGDAWTQSSHTADIAEMAIAPDGKLLASSADDGTVRIWEVATTRLLHVLRPAPGMRAVSIQWDGSDQLLVRGPIVLERKGGTETVSSSIMMRLGIARENTLARYEFMLRATNQQEIAWVKQTSGIAIELLDRRMRSVGEVHIPDGHLVFSQSGGVLVGLQKGPKVGTTSLGIWRLGGRKPTRKSVEMASRYPGKFVVSNDGKTAAGYYDGPFVASLETGVVRKLRLADKKTPFYGDFDQISISPNGEFVTASSEVLLCLWKSKVEVPQWCVKNAVTGQARSLAFGADSASVFAGDSTGRIVRFSVRFGPPLATFGRKQLRPHAIRFDADRGILISSRMPQGKSSLIARWSMVTGQVEWSRSVSGYAIGVELGATVVVSAIASGCPGGVLAQYESSATGMMTVCVQAAADRQATILDVDPVKRRLLLMLEYDGLRVVDFVANATIQSPMSVGVSGRLQADAVIETSGGDWSSALVWRAKDGYEYDRFSMTRNRSREYLSAKTAILSRDMKTIVVSDQARLGWFDLAVREESLRSPPAEEYKRMDALGEKGLSDRWQKPSAILQLDDWIRTQTVDDAGRTLAGGIGGELWRIEKRKLVCKGVSDGGAVDIVEASPSGRLVGTVSEDGTVRLWDAFTCRMIAELIVYEDGSWMTNANGVYCGTSMKKIVRYDVNSGVSVTLDVTSTSACSISLVPK